MSSFRRTWITLTALCLLGGVATWQLAMAREKPTEAEPEARGIPLLKKLQVVKLEAFPTQIQLTNPHSYAQVLITAITGDGRRIDVTHQVKSENREQIVEVGAMGLVKPMKDGKGTLSFRLGQGDGRRVEVPVQVSGQAKEHRVSFVQDVMPALSRMGCNAGTCHGSAKGKNGFKLSLRGYDPLFDHRSLTDDLEGRRFNRAAPDASLMLLKMSGGVPHTGGVLAQKGQPYYELVRAWIAQGVKLDLNSSRVARVEVFPQDPVIELPGMTQQLAVRATYTDGTVRDVTREAFFSSSNGDVAKVSDLGTIAAQRRGEATVMVRYEGAYAATSLIVMGDRGGFQWKKVPEFNFIDKLVYEKLRRVKVLPSELCTDAEFIRRVHIDLTGLPPEPETVRKFLADSRPTQTKRAELVDRLVGNPEYVEYWTNKWADLLQVNRKYLGVPGARKFRDYIEKSVADNKPYNKFAHEILTASGSTMANPAACYYKILRDPDEVMENTTHLFLAIRFNCNKCHDHPFERWTQDQYYEMSAFFAQVNRKPDPKYKGKKVGGTAVMRATPLVEIISDRPSGEVKHLRTGEVAEPTFPYTHTGKVPDKGSRREQLARWITSAHNPYFAKSYVNRQWSYLLGVGLIEPVDDIRAGNPPTNPELLKKLTKEFIDSGFDVRHIHRLICKSRVYQHSVATNVWNEDDEINYSHALARRLPAEVLYDAIHRATGSVTKLPGLPPGARAAELLDSREDVPGRFFNLFGKPPRESACECERSNKMMLGPVLNLVNGPVLADAVKDPNNRIAKLLAREKDDKKIVEGLYLAVLCRMPTERELALGLQALRDGVEDYRAMMAQYNTRLQALKEYEKTLPAKQKVWEQRLSELPDWTPLTIAKASGRRGTKLTVQKDGALLASGKNPTPEIYTVVGKTDQQNITALRLEVLPHESLPAKGPGRAENGNFVLNEFKVLAKANGASQPEPLVFGKAVASFSQDGWNVSGAIDNRNNTGWAVSPKFGQPHTAFFQLKNPLTFPRGGTLTVTLEQRFNGKQHNIGHFRLSVTTAKPPLAFQGPPKAIAKVLAIPADKRTAQQQATLRRHFEAQDPKLAELRADLAKQGKPVDKRQPGAQDLVWALLNSKAFQFNH